METYFASQAPGYLLDPITMVLFVKPVVLPLSGKTVSAHVLAGRPRFDLFANKEFGLDKNVIPNRHLEEQLDEYIEKQIQGVFSKIPEKDAIEQSIRLLVLTEGHNDLSYCVNARLQFSKCLWSSALAFFKIYLSLSGDDSVVLQRTIMSTFQVKTFLGLLAAAELGDVVLLLNFFSSPALLYNTLEVGSMLLDDSQIQKAFWLVRLVLIHKKWNLLAHFVELRQAENDVQSVWLMLNRARGVDRAILNEIVTGLTDSLGHQVVSVLTCDTPIAQALMLAEQTYKQQGRHLAQVVQSRSAKAPESDQLQPVMTNSLVKNNDLLKAVEVTGGDIIKFYRLDQPEILSFTLELPKNLLYDEVVRRLADKLNHDPSKIRLTGYSSLSDQPQAVPIKRRERLSLYDMLSSFYEPVGDKLFYELLEVGAPLSPYSPYQTPVNEMELKIEWHNSRAELVSILSVRVPKSACVKDVLNHIRSVVKLEPRIGTGQLRMMEIFDSRIHKIHTDKDSVKDFLSYSTLRAEEVLKEESLPAPYDRSIGVLMSVVHFQRYEGYFFETHGRPFLIVVHRLDTLAKLKIRIADRLGVPIETIAKWKYATIISGHLRYLKDQHRILSALEHWLDPKNCFGIEHPKNTLSTQ